MAAKLQFSISTKPNAAPGFKEPVMRVLAVIVAAVCVAVVLSATAGCASHAAAPAQVPEPIAYDKADYMPPSEFDMKIDTSNTTFDAPAVKAPPMTVSAPRLVSLEKNASQP
jgi:hypothetical protein